MLVVFDAGKKKYRTVPVAKGKDRLKQLQGLVGGNIELVPHNKEDAAPWTAYANEEGMNLDLPSNFVAFGTLRHLGFNLRYLMQLGTWFFFGNIVLLGKNERGLTEKQLQDVETAYKKYLKEMEESEEEEAESPKKGVKRAREGEDESV